MIRAAWDRLRLFNIGELLAHRGRTTMSMVVMGVSAGLLVSVFSISGSITGSVDKLSRSLGGNAVLEVSGVTDAGFDQGLLQQIRGVDGVRAAVPMLRQSIGGDDKRALLIGADASASELGGEVNGALREQAGKLLLPGSVLAGAAMGYDVGEQLRLGSVSATVVGVLDDEASQRLNSGHIVIALLPVAQQLTDRAGRLDSIQVVPTANADVAQLRSKLTEVVAGRAVVADPGLRAVQAGGTVQLVRYSTLASSAAALIVSAFLIYNAMSMAVAQRRPVLSLLRAIGGRRGPMVRDLIAEAALLGLFGGLVGSLFGLLMGRGAIDRLPAAMLNAVEARTEYIVPGYAVPVAVAACVLASVAAAAIAARQVYKVEPIEALAPVGASTADTASPVLRWGAVVLGGLLVGAGIYMANGDFGRLSMTASALAIGGATRNMVDSAAETFEGLGVTDVFISPSSMAEFPTGPILPADLKAKVAAVPGVEGVGSAQMAFATLGGGRVMLQAFEDGQGRSSVTDSLSAEVFRRMALGEGVVVSRDVARSLGVSKGDTVELPTSTGIHRVEVLEVVPYFSAIAGVVLMDLEVLRQWYQRPGETILGVDFLPGADPAQVQAAIREVVPADLHVDSGTASVAAISSSLQQGTSLSSSILWIVVLVATIALLNTLMLSVLERRRELGVLRAMGTSRRFLLRAVLAEAAGIGVVGAGLGLAIGAAVHYLVTIAMTNTVSVDVVYQPSPLLVVYAVIALILALLDSIPPAVRAARLPIVEAIAVD
ncbi:ABC transporter permease [Nocardia crassostreae]|uniref:ABC transporter permease n=1 Tax=Nocardia crassostreae TaxID=53428 RepID=UPI0008371DEF|nr:ABC transporter permease [Nocardia crassostreae]